MVARITEQNPHLSERDVEALVNVILNRISDALLAGKRVELRGLAAFTVKSCGARTGRNPKTGEAVTIAGRLLPAFKVWRAMQAHLNAFGAPAECKL